MSRGRGKSWVSALVLVLGLLLAGSLRAAASPSHDPFQTLVRPPVVTKHVVPVRVPVPVVAKPEPPRLQVRALVGEAGRWVALVKLDGEEHIVEKGWSPPDGEFTVRRIDGEGVVVEIVDRRGERRLFQY